MAVAGLVGRSGLEIDDGPGGAVGVRKVHYAFHDAAVREAQEMRILAVAARGMRRSLEYRQRHRTQGRLDGPFDVLGADAESPGLDLCDGSNLFGRVIGADA